MSVWPAAPQSRGPVLRRASGRRRARHGATGRRLASGVAMLGAALAALAWFVQTQNTVPEQVIRGDLDRQGLGTVSLTVAGRDIHLSGALPAGVTPDFALSIAHGSICRFWLVSRQCAGQVTGDFPQAAAAPAPKAPAEPAPATAPAALAAVAAGVTPDVTGAPAITTRANAVVAAVTAAPATTAAPPAPAPAPSAAGNCAARAAQVAADGEPLQFQIRSSELAPAATPMLDRLARALSNCQGAVQIEGHTDSRGREANNRALSLARAGAVRAALQARGVATDRLSAVGMGSSRAKFDNETVEGRRANRRIEFVDAGP